MCNKFLSVDKSLKPVVPTDSYHPALNNILLSALSLPVSHTKRDHQYLNFSKGITTIDSVYFLFRLYTFL